MEFAAARGLRDEGSLTPGAVVAPEVVVAERLQFFSHGNYTRSGRVNREGGDLVSRNLGGGDRFLHGFTESAHVVSMALRGVIGVFLFAMERILSDAPAETALAAVHDRDANAERSEIHSVDDGHEALFLPALSGVFPSNSHSGSL